LPLQCLLAVSVARVAPVVTRRVVLLVAQMIGHLGLQGPLQDGLGQFLEQAVFPDDILGLLVVAEQLVDQLLVDCHGTSYFLPPMVVYTVLFTPSIRTTGRVLRSQLIVCQRRLRGCLVSRSPLRLRCAKSLLIFPQPAECLL